MTYKVTDQNFLIDQQWSNATPLRGNWADLMHMAGNQVSFHGEENQMRGDNEENQLKRDNEIDLTFGLQNQKFEICVCRY